MSTLREETTRALQKTKAGKAAMSIHAAETAEKIAERIKDAGALEGALIQKLEYQRDFAVEYKKAFPHRGVRIDASTGINSPDDWCKSYGFVLRTVQRWTELLDPEVFAARKTAIIKRCWALAEMWQAANFSSDSIEWYTPARYLEPVRQVLGEIDLDPASSAQANGAVKAKTIFTKDDDGLHKPWFGRFFMNPPYGSTPEYPSLAGAFCRKAIEEYNSKNVSAGIILVNSLHSQHWQAPLYDFTICFVDHRIQFVSADGEENKSPTFQNIFIYLGEDVLRFAEVFQPFGYVMRKVSPDGNAIC